MRQILFFKRSGGHELDFLIHYELEALIQLEHDSLILHELDFGDSSQT